MPNDPPVFFVSYARADVEYESYRKHLKRFVADLSASVAVKLTRPLASVPFFDSSSIETGDVWPATLADGLRTSQVGVALYSPNYFTRPWCGKEFSAFLARRQGNQNPSGIVPVLWLRLTSDPPSVVDEFQYKDGAFPKEYAQLGMHGLVSQKKKYPEKYDAAIEVLAQRIESAAKGHSLVPADWLDPETLPSAWDQVVAGDRHSHKVGGISKTCFVFASTQGWSWKPYSSARASIGALAQRISGDLGVQYEELKYDATLTTKLAETNSSKVPTVIFADPTSLANAAYARPMQNYDKQYLLNCAALVPWDEASRQAGDNDALWVSLRRVLSQKTDTPPPHHEWRSIFSNAELEVQARITIEQIRSKLMKQVMSEAGTATPLRKAVDSTVTENAAAQGIRIESPAQLEGPSR